MEASKQSLIFVYMRAISYHFEKTKFCAKYQRSPSADNLFGSFSNAVTGLKMANIEIQEKVLKYESFINDVLKEDLKEIHQQMEKKNTEIAEWVQLKTVLNSLKDAELTEGFKTKMDIGTNVYVQVNVPDASKILINIGSGIYVEYTHEEALRVIEKRIDLLNKQMKILKTNSAQIKARIKLVLHGIQEISNIK